MLFLLKRKIIKHKNKTYIHHKRNLRFYPTHSGKNSNKGDYFVYSDSTLTRKNTENSEEMEYTESTCSGSLCPACRNDLPDTPLLLSGERSEGGELLVKYPLHLLPPLSQSPLPTHILCSMYPETRFSG